MIDKSTKEIVSIPPSPFNTTTEVGLTKVRETQVQEPPNPNSFTGKLSRKQRKRNKVIAPKFPSSKSKVANVVVLQTQLNNLAQTTNDDTESVEPLSPLRRNPTTPLPSLIRIFISYTST